jgi:hypothetical protein
MISSKTPPQWAAVIRRLISESISVFSQSGTDECMVRAYMVVNAQGAPLVWVIKGDRDRSSGNSRPKPWQDMVDFVCETAGNILSSNKDGCAIASVEVYINREKEMVDWRVGDVRRIEPSNQAATIMRSLTGVT